MDKVKIFSEKYSQIAGEFEGRPFSITLENGFAVVEENLAHYVKSRLTDIEIIAVEEDKKDSTKVIEEAKDKVKAVETEKEEKKTDKKAK